MDCLCGHFEFCEHCRTQPPTPEERERIKAMRPEDWARSYAVSQQPKNGATSALVRSFGEACGRSADEIILRALEKE